MTLVVESTKASELGIANMTPEHSDSLKHILDAVSVVTAIGAVVQVLPAIAALFTIIWTGIRIWESPTVQNLVRKK